ncbi:MAG: iron-only hydrogenase system regulator [Candidatus Zophobacter franzmannii]|nr:iron-only hydrogenase system regulator [Candidatus Zophobacter franzmannii]
MERILRTITITVTDREAAYNIVNELVHEIAIHIKLRTGFPMPEKNASILFLIVELTNDELGAFSGKLGQLDAVSVKSTTLKI